MKKESDAKAVIEACVAAAQSSSPAVKAKATKLLNEYVEQRVAEGYGDVQVRAAIKAHVTRRLK